MRFLRKVSSIAPIAIALSLLTALPATAATPPPPSLVGEMLVNDNPTTDADAFTLSCAADGSGTISWNIDGIATGPYPGNFTETGSLTIAPGTDATGRTRNAVTSVQASFVIASPVGIVRGSKTLNPVDVFYAPLGICQRPIPNSPYLLSSFQATVKYEATITTTDAVYAETGLGDLSGLAIPNQGTSGPGSGQLVERFETTSSGGPVFVALLTPTSVDQCKKDAYKQYLIFKNQGDCVAFVQTDGKNEPGQNIPSS